MAEAKPRWGIAHWADAAGSLIVHMYPLFGPEHELSPTCWCCPVREEMTNEHGGHSISYDHNVTQ